MDNNIYDDSERIGLKVNLNRVVKISKVLYNMFKKPYYVFTFDNGIKIRVYLKPPKEKIQPQEELEQIESSRLWFYENWSKIQRDKAEAAAQAAEKAAAISATVCEIED